MLKLTDIAGKWYIIQSNFPMWLKGDKLNPTFNYTVLENNARSTHGLLLDEVTYTKNGKQHSIKGIDKVLNSNHTEFIWRGNGILFLLKSRWQIIYCEPDASWAIIHFDKTLFTPEGFDVIAKDSQAENRLKPLIESKFRALGITEQLKSIKQN